MSINKEDIPKYQKSTAGREGQSDAPVVVKVGELIDMAMGPIEKNTVNFKMIQTILHILARNMRLQDQPVELRSLDAAQPQYSKKEIPELAYFEDMPSWTESENRPKTAATTAKRKEKAESHTPKDQEKIEPEINKKEKKDTASSSSSSSFLNMEHVNMDKIMATHFEEEEKTEPEDTKQAKLVQKEDKASSSSSSFLNMEHVNMDEMMATYYEEEEKTEPEDAKQAKLVQKEDTASSTSSSFLKMEHVNMDEIMATHFEEEEKTESEYTKQAKLVQKEDTASSSSASYLKMEHVNMDEIMATYVEEEEKTEPEDTKQAKLVQKEDMGSPSSFLKMEHVNMDEIMATYFDEEEKTEPEHTKQAKLVLIRKIYLHEHTNKEREKTIKERVDRYKDKEDLSLSAYENEKEKIATVDGTEGGSFQVGGKETREKEKAKYRKKESAYLASSSSVLSSFAMYDSSDDDENQKLSCEIERVKNNSQMEPEEKLAKIAAIQEMHIREKEREKAKVAAMNDEERDTYLKDKEERKIMKERERHEKEEAKLAKLDDKEKKDHLISIEEKKKAKLDAEENNKAGYKKRESLSDIEERKRVNLEQREKYLENKEKEEVEMLKNKDGADIDIEKDKERKKYETEIPLLEKVNDEENKKYIQNKKQRESAKLDAMDTDGREGDKIYKRDLETDLKQNEIEESQKAKHDVKNIEKKHKDKENMSEDNEEEMAKLRKMNDDEKEKYLRVEEQREQAKYSALKKDRAEKEIDEKEKANIALMNETERKQFLNQKEKLKLDAHGNEKEDRDNEIESKLDKKEMEKIANMDNQQKEKYFKDKEERKKANFDAQNREITGKEMDEKEKTKLALMNETERDFFLAQKKKEDVEKIKLDALKQPTEREKKQEKEREQEMDEKENTKIALMNETEREKYLKQKQKEGIEKSKLDALKERAEREKKQREQEMDEKEKTKLALMNETEREIYIKLKEKEEKEKSELDALDELKERAEREKKQENEREREKIEKEKTKMALMNETDRRKYLKKIEKEEKTKSKLDALNREQAEKDKKREQEREYKQKREREQEKEKESERNLKEKEWAKGKDSRTRVGSIEVVTRSEFEVLEAKVNELQDKTSPIPYPSMPDNQKLRTDLARGSASLTETMQAMQVTSRVQATESAMARMADLLTQLAVAGALPEDVVQQVGEVTAGMGRPPPGETLSRGGLASRSVGASSNMRGPAGRSIASSPRDGDEHTRNVGTSVDRETIDETFPSVGTVIDERIRSVGTIMDERTHATVGFGTDADKTERTDRKSSTKIVGSGSKYTGVTSASRALFHFSSCVTHPELDDAQRELKDCMLKKANNMVLKALRLAEIADTNVKKVSDQMDIATSVASRIGLLFSLVNDYAEQLAGFDAGVTTQLQNFNEQMFQSQSEMQEGVALLNRAIANPETEAVRELNKKYEELVMDLDVMRNTLQKLGYFQDGIGDDTMSLISSVEALRAEKADRDELLDGIKDKVDKKCMNGLVKLVDFEPVRIEMEQRLDYCYNKFKAQDDVWTVAMEDLLGFAKAKASGSQLFEFTYKMEIELNNIKDELHSLASAIGEPMAILLSRKISEGGSCGPCQAPARQKPTADCQPPLLPAAVRKPPPIAEEPCKLLVKQPRQLDEREHICKRWTGGSHTLVNKSVVHQESGDIIRMNMPPTKKYTGIGIDGKLYQLEEALQPCGDCNTPGQEETKVQEEGAGEPGVKKLQLNFE